MRFSDQMLECRQCGTKFIFTVDEQRRTAEQGLEIKPPELCPVCRSEIQTRTQRSERARTERSERVEGIDTDTSAGLSTSVGSLARSPALSVANGEGNVIRFTERYYGEVKWFNQSKGYGFITRENGKDIFVHYTGIEGKGYKVLVEGQRVEFEIDDTPKGPQAVHVIPLEGR